MFGRRLGNLYVHEHDKSQTFCLAEGFLHFDSSGMWSQDLNISSQKQLHQAACWLLPS